MNNVAIKKIYDLSQPLYHNCPGWVEYPSTHITRDYHIAVNGFNAEMLHMNTHTGTHLDVPFHFYQDGDTIEKVALESFAGPGVFCDLRHKKPDTPITPEDMQPFMSCIERGDWVILNTGMGKKRGFNKEYLMGWAYLDGPGAEALVKAGDVVVGITTSGNSPNILKALAKARELGAVTVGLTGRTGGQMRDLCDICIRIPADVTARIQEAHLLIEHMVCQRLEE